MMTPSSIRGFLADTWWFGLSQRLSERQFKNLATLRATQGFSAIQLVVGVPPEVGPGNENARSQVGFPWTLDGKFNQDYLELAGDRIKYLNDLGLIVIVYGAWGHQIEWLGREGMTQWWLRIIDALDSLHVVYCLCGESSLWVGEASKLLPNKTTGDLVANQLLPALAPRIKELLTTTTRSRKYLGKRRFDKRRSDWSSVLEEISQRTNRPVIVHTIPDETGCEAVSNPHLLLANTIQTGHDASARNRLWQLPLALLRDDSTTHKELINLEPWYEGIKDQFWAKDQLFSYWVSMLAGVTSYCYGAHGIWNVGDGEFLAHWGKQTFTQALALDTPRLLGLSHRQYLLRGNYKGETFHQISREELITIGKQSGKKIAQFFPEIARAQHVPRGKIWLPLRGAFTNALPQGGQVVIFAE